METSGSPRGPDIRAVDLSALADVATAEGPFLSVYLPTPGNVENAAQRSQAQWKTLRRDLQDRGAPDVALDAVELLVENAHTHGDCLAAVATERGLLHHEYGPQRPGGAEGRWAPVPAVVPIIEWRQTSLPFVAVLADLTGADLYGFRREGRDLHREAAGGDDPHIHKGKPGGWSQRRFQERAEHHWEERADEVAKATARLSEQIEARLIIVAGDPRALPLIRDALPPDARDILHPLEGEGGQAGSVDDLRDAFAAIARAVADQDTAQVIEAWREQAGRGDRGTEGPRETIQALSRSQVEVLLVHDDPEESRSAWFGPEPTAVAADPQPLRDMGVEDPAQGPLPDVLVRAALGTGAGVRIVPRQAGIQGGVGALLRWAD